MVTHSSILAWRSLVGYRPQDHKESYVTEVTYHKNLVLKYHQQLLLPSLRVLDIEHHVTLQHRQHIKKQRHYFANKVPSSQSYGSSSSESWTIKKAEGRRIDAFELWCWRRLLRVPWIARRSNQSILKEISAAYSLEGLMLKLKL